MRARMLTLLAALAISVAACTPADDNGVDNSDLIDPGGIQSPAMSEPMMMSEPAMSDDTGG